MTHVPEIDSIFLALVSCMYVMHIWHRIRMVPDSSAN